KIQGQVPLVGPKSVAAALAAAAVIAAGTQAYAAPVRFDNPAHGDAGHFHWVDAGFTEYPWAGHGGLDVAAPAGGQPGSYYSLSSVDQQTNYPGLGYLGVNGGYYAGGVQRNGYYFVVGLDSGTLIPAPGLSFAQRANCYYPGYTYIPEGVAAYIGLRFGDQWCGYYGSCQYGWIGVVRTGAELEAFAWGYESEPGAPIAAGAGGPTGQPGDMDDDGDVDPDDIPSFVSALLGQPLPSGHVDRSDMTGDGDSDGDDIQPFVDRLLQ
ncbi:hypothetical protein LCGC14_2673760, partial [marine sediment metagenome]